MDRIDTRLYVELLEAEVKRLRATNQQLELRLKAREMHEGTTMRRHGAVVSGMLGVTPAEAADELNKSEYAPPRNLQGASDAD